jgi:hypothetical protein
LPANLISRGRFTYADDFFPGFSDSSVIVTKTLDSKNPWIPAPRIPAPGKSIHPH